MPPLLPLSPTLSITTCLLAIPPTLYLFNTYCALQPSFQHPIRASRSISPSFARSRTVNVIVNPTGHAVGGDVHSVVIPVSQLPRGRDGKVIDDRELVGKLVTGFFGGWVFTPERWALRAWRAAGGGSFLGVRCVEAEAESSGREFWTAREVREVERRGWEVGVRVGGAFQVVDVVVKAAAGNDKEERAAVQKRGSGDDGVVESHVDFLFGSDKGRLKGAHRLAVLRRKEAGQEVYELRLAGVACNPRAKSALPSWMLGFHMMYSKMLFREAVAEVLASRLTR